MITGGSGETGLEPVNRVVSPQQPVAVELPNFRKGVLRHRVVLQGSREVSQIVDGKQRHVMGCGDLSPTRQSVRIVKVAACHAQPGRRFVHHLDEALFAAGKVLGNRHARVVSRHHRDALDQFLKGHSFSLPHEHFGAAGSPGFLTDENLVRKGRLTIFNEVEYHVQSKHLGKRGRRNRLILVLLLEDLSGRVLHQHRAPGTDRKPASRFQHQVGFRNFRIRP